MDLTTGEGKQRALNFLMPYVQKIPNQLLRSEWATRISQQLRIDEPVLRAALNKAAAERRSEVKVRPELVGKAGKPAERRLIRMLVEAEDFKRDLAQRLKQGRLYQGLETEKIFAALIVAGLSDEPMPPTEIGAMLEERDRRVFFEILFEEAHEGTWEEAESCMEALRGRQVEQELAQVQREIERNPSGAALRDLLARKQELLKRRAAG
jgi:DNA primase